jgi:hypothetical protein
MCYTNKIADIKLKGAGKMNGLKIVFKIFAVIFIISSIILSGSTGLYPANTVFCPDTVSATSFKEISSTAFLDGYKLYQSDGYLELYATQSGSVAVKDDANNRIYTSDISVNSEYNGYSYDGNCAEIFIKYIYQNRIYTASTMDDNATSQVYLNAHNEGGINVTYKIPLIRGNYFSVRVKYYLESSRLNVKMTNFEYPQDDLVTILQLEFLKGFGTEIRDDNTFYILPDGNGGKYSLSKDYKTNTLTTNIYSTDKSVYPVYVKEDVAPIPFFSKSDKNGGLFAMLSEGESIADIVAERNDEDKLSFIYPVFNLSPYFKKDLSGKQFVVYSHYEYNNPITISYNFVDNSNNTVEGLAEICREELFRSGFLYYTTATDNNASSVTLYFDGDDISYKEAKKILEYAKAEGIGNMTVVYKNALNGVKPYMELGMKEDLRKLSKFCRSSNIDLYTEYSISKDSGEKIVNLLRDKLYFKGKEAFNKSVDKIFIADETYFENIYVKYLGQMLYSDFKDKITNREEMKTEISNYLEKLSADHNIAVDCGNAYTLKNADKIFNLKREKSKVADGYESVLFNSFALHGEIDYTFAPITIAGKITTQIDRALENGTMPCFNITSKGYKSELAIVADCYIKYGPIIAQIKDKNILSHSKSDDLSITTFEGGYNLYVNNSKETKAVSEKEIEPGGALLQY